MSATQGLDVPSLPHDTDQRFPRFAGRFSKGVTSLGKLPKLNLSQFGAVLCLSLSVVVLGISMPHLADGVSTVTDCNRITALFMACVFDLSQIAAEFTSMVIPIVGIKNNRVQRACSFIMVSCTFVSMTMNVRAFLANVETLFETVMAVVWGILLPILVLLLCYIASEFLMSTRRTGRKKR